MSKNIEKIKGEDALSEIVSVTLDDAKLNGLVSNDLADMYQRASGLKPLKPIDTYESPIVELKANLKLIFRRLFSVPLTMLGSNKEASPISVIEMFRSMFNHYRERLKGSETYGIPSRLSSLTDLPSAPLLLADRKINGIADDVDGISIPNLLCSATGITEIFDDNEPWVYNRNFPWSLFPNAKKATFNCTSATSKTIFGGSNLEEAHAPFLDHTEYVSLLVGTKVKNFVCNSIKEMLGGNSGHYGQGCSIERNSELETIEMQGLTKITSNCYAPIRNCAKLEEVDWRSVEYIAQGDRAFIMDCPMCWKIRLGKLIYMNDGYASTSNKFAGDNLIHFEIGQDTAISLPFRRWSPTNALDASLDTLVTDEDCHNNLEQFLKNFRTYIIHRLANRQSDTALTLTLSQNVLTAVTTETSTLEALGITELTSLEQELGITLQTQYKSWLETYCDKENGGINWNITA